MPEAWHDGAFFMRKFLFRFGDCDRAGNASLYAVMRLFSELAGEDFERRGLGFDVLGARGQALLIARLRLNIHRLPVHTEQTAAVTWERGSKGPYFLRDFELRSTEGEQLISAASQWFMVDRASREVLRPNVLGLEHRQLDPRRADCPDCEKPAHCGKLLPLGLRPVFYSDLDLNGHVNNAVYSRIAVDFLPEALRERTPAGVSVSFLKETKLGETLELFGEVSGDCCRIRGSVGGAPHFAVDFTY
jgi:acyl-ACP thioesterase